MLSGASRVAMVAAVAARAGSRRLASAAHCSRRRSRRSKCRSHSDLRIRSTVVRHWGRRGAGSPHKVVDWAEYLAPRQRLPTL